MLEMELRPMLIKRSVMPNPVLPTMPEIIRKQTLTILREEITSYYHDLQSEAKSHKQYRDQGFDFLDLGPAASDGIASEGLCTFKESVGCFADLKYAFVFDGSAGTQAEGRV